MTDKVQLIKAEIERYKKHIEDPLLSDHDLIRGEKRAISYVLKIIDSLPEEQVSEDLEKASKEWLIPQLDKSYASYGETKMMEFTHFDGYAMLDAIEFGAQWQMEQMIKSAKLSGWVARDENGFLHLFEVEPSRIMHRWWDRDYHSTTLDNKDFPDLEWEDEPVYVKLPIIVED